MRPVEGMSVLITGGGSGLGAGAAKHFADRGARVTISGRRADKVHAVAASIGAIARPRQVFVVSELPKTRSGKIMRRLLRDVAENRSMGDVTTLADPSVMNLIETGLQSGASED